MECSDCLAIEGSINLGDPHSEKYFSDSGHFSYITELLGCWTRDQQVSGSNTSLSAVECNPEQVDNTHASVTKQYNLVPVNGW